METASRGSAECRYYRATFISALPVIVLFGLIDLVLVWMAVVQRAWDRPLTQIVSWLFLLSIFTGYLVRLAMVNLRVSANELVLSAPLTRRRVVARSEVAEIREFSGGVLVVGKGGQVRMRISQILLTRDSATELANFLAVPYRRPPRWKRQHGR